MLKVGQEVKLTFKSTSNSSSKNNIYLFDVATIWYNNTNKIITQEMLDSRISLYGGYNEIAVISEFMISEKISSYVPHAEQNLPFTLASGERMYQGSKLEDDGKHHIRKQFTIANSHIYSLITLNNGNKGCLIYPTNKKNSTGNNVLCNKAINSLTFEEGTFYENPANIVIVGNENDTIETFKEKYVGAIIEYELETEEIIPYNATQQAQYNAIKKATSYAEKTYKQSTSDELNPDLDVIAYKEVPKMMKFI